MKEQLLQILAVCAVVCFFIPLIIVLLRKLWKDRAFRLFSLYWCFTGLINATDYLVQLNAEVKELVNVLYNMADVPFLMCILFITSRDRIKRNFLIITGVLYLVVLVSVVALKGITYNSGKYPLGVGLIIILIIVTWTIFDFLMKLRHSRRQRSLLYIHAAILFQFGTFVIIYVFDYFVAGSSQADSFLIYYTSSVVALLIAIFGLTRKGLARELNRENRQSMRNEFQQA